MKKLYRDFPKSKYIFMKTNITETYLKKFRDDLGESRAFKLSMLYQSMGWYNDIDFSVLELSDGGLNKFRALISKKGYIKRMRLSDKAGFLWYLNPLYGNRDKACKELWEAFDISPDLYTNY